MRSKEEPRHFVTYVMAEPDGIWEEITTPDRNADWYMTCHALERNKGARVAWGPGDDPVITGEVRAFDQSHHFFAHTFAFTFLDEAPSLVRWRVTPMGEVTQVWLRHELEGRPQTEQIVGGSWNVILARLKTHCETGRNMPEPQWPEDPGWDADPG